jgi:DNA polymerase III delta prime subunit
MSVTPAASTNMTVLTVDKAISHLQMAFVAIINGGLPVVLMPSVMLWGPPGVGKSQGVRQLAAEIEVETGKKVQITDVRLLLFNPIDLRGIPTANADKTLAVWLKPKIFQFSGKDAVVPTSPDSLYAVVSSMVAYARRRMADIDSIAHSIKYVLKLPPDFATILIKDYFVFGKEFKKQLMLLPELMTWLQRSGKYLV